MRSNRLYLSGHLDPGSEIHNYPDCDDTGSASPGRVMVTLQAELSPKTNAHVVHSFAPINHRFQQKQTDKTVMLCFNMWIESALWLCCLFGGLFALE